MGNSSGTSREIHTLDYFDRLPRSVRAAVATARFNWALGSWLSRFDRGQISAKALVKHIEAVDQLEAAKERRKVWGADYPILRGEIAQPRKQKQPQRRPRA